MQINENRLKGISCKDVREKVLNNEKPFLIDVRDLMNLNQMRLGIAKR